MLKRKIITFITAMLMLVLLVACGKASTETKETVAETNTQASEESKENTVDDKKNVVVTTSFLQDMTEQIAGDTVNIELIIPAGEDPHLYVAKPEDYTKLKEADLVLYHGLHFEGKMVEALEAKGEAVSRNFPADKI